MRTSNTGLTIDRERHLSIGHQLSVNQWPNFIIIGQTCVIHIFKATSACQTILANQMSTNTWQLAQTQKSFGQYYPTGSRQVQYWNNEFRMRVHFRSQWIFLRFEVLKSLRMATIPSQSGGCSHRSVSPVR